MTTAPTSTPPDSDAPAEAEAAPSDGAPAPRRAPAPGSLQPALDAIPAECYERPLWRSLPVLARDLALYTLALVGLALTDTWWLLIPLWALAGLSVAALFVIGHDAAHQALTDSRRLNDLIARVTMVPSAHIAEAWVFGHNRVHHRHTVKRGFDFVWHPVTPDEYAAMGRFERLRHKVEWSPLGSGAYYLREVWWSKMMRFEPPARSADRIRTDRRIVFAAHGLVALTVLAAGVAGLGGLGVLGAVWLWVKLVVVPFLLFCGLIGWAVHVHHIGPDLRWYDRRDWTKFKAQVEGTTILHAPRWLDLFFHSIFEHAPHHVDPRIPFFHLRRAARALADALPDHVVEHRLSLRSYWSDARACKLYDFDAGRWMTYREARAQLAA